MKGAINCSYSIEAISGGRVLKPSCNLRYEVSLFFGSTSNSLVDISAPVPAAPAPEEAKKKSNTKQTVIIIIVVVLVVFVTIFSSICFFFRVKKRRVKLEQGLEKLEGGYS
ncbi:putative receptor-like protein kinase [Prunus yedoensis var. nudiflora]|uniref:Putative receptor-like protein kinase n=1 Tax=Prunus yedoensis var. nudiflora TaxID=2094558 RepID=A0A314XJ93_PRUYE|nr:putative receptor-like protein kinase [Prunus yedoensis var. nudiflora]